MKLNLIRHTSLQIAPGICYGQSDIDVAHTFPLELERLRTKLANTEFNAIYTSPLQRCTKLAHALQASSNLADSRVHHGLMELNFGEWEMQNWDDIPRHVFDHWAQNYALLAPPKGETFSQLQQRGVQFLEEMLQQHASENILAITHGGMIRALLAHVLNMPLKGLFRFNIDHASVTQLDFSEKIPKIVYVNL